MSLMEEHKRFLERFVTFLGEGNVIESKIPRERRIFVLIKVDKLRDAVTYLRDNEGFTHISTITGLDRGEDIEVIYHLTKKDLSINLKVRVPYDKPVVPSITDILNGAVLYEREIHDLVGVVPEGHPNLKPLVLPEHWPEDVHPLLKKWDLDSIRKKIDEGGERKE